MRNQTRAENLRWPEQCSFDFSEISLFGTHIAIVIIVNHMPSDPHNWPRGVGNKEYCREVFYY